MPYRKGRAYGKPPVGSWLDWNDPINKDVVVRLLFNEGAGSIFRNLAGHDVFALTNVPSSTSGWFPRGAWGCCWKGDTTASSSVNPKRTGASGNIRGDESQWTGGMSFSGWYKLLSAQTGGCIASIGGGGTSTTGGWNLQILAATIVLSFKAADGTSTQIFTVTTTSNDDKWHHILVDFFFSTGTAADCNATIYVDGVPQSIVKTGTGAKPVTLSGAVLRFGLREGNIGTFASAFDGQFDNITFWKRSSPDGAGSTMNSILGEAAAKRLYGEPFAGIYVPRRRIISAVAAAALPRSSNIGQAVNRAGTY